MKGATQPAGRGHVHHGISIHAPVKGATYETHEHGSETIISIHAPVKGATGPLALRVPEHVISIHAPVKGATSRWSCYVHMVVNFNPRSREGSDPLSPATGPGCRYFNPRSREGSDHRKRGRVVRTGKFQSTLP